MFSSNFNFDSLQSPFLDSTNNSTRDTSRSASPCSPTDRFSSPRYSVTDLAAQLDRQRIRPDAQICYQPCDSYANTDDDAGWTLPLAATSSDEELSPALRVRTVPARCFSPSRRLQRQTNSRLLCSSTHHKDIAVLLSRMVNSSEQCSVSPPKSLAHATTREVEDEGYDSADDERCALRRSSVATLKRGLDYRRASDFRKTGAAISKDVRFRSKEKLHRRQRSAEKA